MSRTEERDARKREVGSDAWPPRQRRIRSKRVKAKWTPHLTHSVGQDGSVDVKGLVATPHGFVLAQANTTYATCEIVLAGRKYCLSVVDDAGGLVNELPRIAGQFAAECAQRSSQIPLRIYGNHPPADMPAALNVTAEEIARRSL